LQNYQDFGVTDYQYNLLKKFYGELRIFSMTNHIPHEFIDSPEWQKIMDLAKEALFAFNYKKTS
jgi:hypothetical protein